MGPINEKAVAKQFASYYCSTAGACTPSRGVQDFQWSRLIQEPGSAFTWWWDELYDWLLWWGAIWGCVDSFLTVLVWMHKVCTVICHAGKTDIPKGTLIKFVFTPGQELVNLFPGKPARPRAPAPVPGPENKYEVQPLTW